MKAKPRILIVSHWFPPHLAIGALRVGKLAKYLDDRQWDVRALAAHLPVPKTMPLEIAPEKAIFTEWTDVDNTLERLLGRRFEQLVRRKSNAGIASAATTVEDKAPEAGPSALRKFLRSAYLDIVRLPDNRAGWFKPAVAAGNELISRWKPDVIYASAPPVTSVLVAHALARKHGVPWIAEFRDLWTDHPYYEYGKARAVLDRLWESRVLSTASAIVTVSPSWQSRLIERHGRPTVLAMNGFVESDFPLKPPAEVSRSGPVRILYTGHIYVGRRDPSPLFEALQKLGPAGKNFIVDFVGTQVDVVRPLAEKYGLSDIVTVHPSVPYREALRLQLEADILLHLQWCSPEEQGTIAGKLFEYIGARRPILGIALETSEAAQLVQNRNAGLATNDVAKITEWLREKAQQKYVGGIPALPPSASEGLERDRQFERIERLLDGIVATPSPPNPRTGRDPVGFKVTPKFKPVSVSSVAKPTLVVLIDVEEEFDWTKPFSSDNRSVKALTRLPAVHELFRKHGITPTYLVDYPIVDAPEGAKMFREWHAKGECVIGTQLHPWVNPPFEEEVGIRNSYPGHLPQTLEFAKLETLTRKIEETCGVKPVIYRAGRYGLGPHSIDAMERLGYLIDTSIVPYTDFRSQQGPNYADYSPDPFWFGRARSILELPLSRGFAGPLRHIGSMTQKWLVTRLARRARLSGVFARLGLLERVTLTPEGITIEEMKRLTMEGLADGRKIFTFSFHSPSLFPGSTPYVRTEDDAARFVKAIDDYLEFFMRELKGEGKTPLQLLEHFKSQLSPLQ